MPIIIDGWNLIRDGQSEIDTEDAIESASILISRLSRFQDTHNDPIILVFDSKNEFLGIQYKNTPKLRVIAAADADSCIKNYIDNVPDRQKRNVRMVSSDRDLYYYAKDSGAIPIKSGEFWAKI